MDYIPSFRYNFKNFDFIKTFLICQLCLDYFEIQHQTIWSYLKFLLLFSGYLLFMITLFLVAKASLQLTQVIIHRKKVSKQNILKVKKQKERKQKVNWSIKDIEDNIEGVSV